ncbi:hypothetical protein PSZ84_23265, partial [Shigella sonnei]|nr:hypothetical protein [Shigella sonnei]
TGLSRSLFFRVLAFGRLSFRSVFYVPLVFVSCDLIRAFGVLRSSLSPFCLSVGLSSSVGRLAVFALLVVFPLFLDALL